jgi:hypothetical protein
VYATNAFYDALVKVPDYRTLAITVVAQKVQRSAYPEAYADHEPDARVLASALTGQSAASMTCTLDADRAPAGAAGVPEFERALRVELTAQKPVRLTGSAGVRIPAADAAATWATAHWAVAQADRLGVARVYAGGRMWSRAERDGGWVAAAVPGSDRGVVVMFAESAPPAG